VALPEVVGQQRDYEPERGVPSFGGLAHSIDDSILVPDCELELITPQLSACGC
jgi:hypothetical protein